MEFMDFEDKDGNVYSINCEVKQICIEGESNFDTRVTFSGGQSFLADRDRTNMFSYIRGRYGK